MRPKGRIVLVELLIAFLFFSLSAVIALQLFARAYGFSRESTLRADALRRAQSVADILFASDSAEQLLMREGFERRGETYALEDGGVTYTVELSAKDAEAGVVQNARVSALHAGETLFSLPVARYEGRESP